jgi:adenylosuccinate lyase
MERNLMGSYGLFFSQRVLLALVEAGWSRQKAYEAVQKVAMACWNERRSFPEAVRADATLRAALSAEALDALFDARFYLRHEDAIFTRVLGGA